ncbi:MAG TPA: glycosyltransferase, partial [Candidatus Paceibacterota bacterium]|nr:glycosyltransferase [Candidatus Paceibacterota bacterium]
MTKVLFVSNDPMLFDAASAVRARMRTYAALVDELHIVSPARMGAREEQDGNLFLHPVHSWKLLRVRALASLAHALILQYGIDVVSAQDPFEQGLAALRAVAGTRAKLHIQVHTDFLSPWFVKSGNWRSPNVRMPLLNRWRCSVADGVLPHAAGIRVVSERIKTSLIARYGSRIPEPAVIPVAVSSVVPEPVPLPDHSFTFVLITTGRLEPEKRIEDILAALKLVIAHYPTVGLLIVGDGRERWRLERMVRRLGLSGNVIFTRGWQSAERAWGMVRSAHAYIQASAYEGYGRSLIEAALAKVPIVTTDVGIVGEVFKG